LNSEWHKNSKLQESNFEAFFLTYYQNLFLVGFKMCGDKEFTKDALQNFFLEIWEKREKLQHVEYWNAYLKKSFYRKMLEEIKKNKYPTISLSETTHQISTASYETLLINFQSEKIQQANLQNALAQLPDQQKEMLKLRFFEGMNYDDIAKDTGKSKQTVYNQIYEAVKKLKKMLTVFV